MNGSIPPDIGGRSFWETNGSILLPGDINLRWEDYREIVQPDKASFWVMLGSLLLFVIWVLFLTYYMSRVFGPIVAFIFTRLAHLKGYDVQIIIGQCGKIQFAPFFLYYKFLDFPLFVNLAILFCVNMLLVSASGSFSISLLSGKIMFRNFRCICQNFSFCCNDGWIIFSYWNYIPSNYAHKSNISRLHISLNGVQLHVYNRLTSYRRLARYFGIEKLFVPLKDETDAGKARKLTKEEELEWDKYYDSLWSLIGYIKLDISSGRLVAGNALLPSMMVLSFENYTSKISLKEYGRGDDMALLSVIGGTENVRVSVVQCSQFLKKSHQSIRCCDPPRTMGDGFAVVQTAHLNFFYNQSILGVVKEGQQSMVEDPPVWESVWRFDKNTVFSYGPWADAQRTLLYDFFFPPEHRNAEVTVMPKEGERRILLSHDMRISLLSDAAIDLWFMRGDELNALHLRVKQGSSVDLKMPWVTTDQGFVTTLRCCFLFVESSTSLIYPKFFQCETLRLSLNVHYPRVFNAHQLWKFAVEINKISAWVVWDHKHFFTDLINEWTSSSSPDLFSFVPYTWEFEINVTDSFELFLLLNENNWINTSSSISAENHLAAIVGKNVAASFALPFLDFCPETITTVYEINVHGMLGLRAWLPPKSPLYSVLHSLLKYAPFAITSPTTENLPTISNLAEDWVELWRTESITLLFEYTYYPLYRDPLSDLPSNVIRPSANKQTTPMALPPDQLLLEVTIDDSEVVLVGLIIRLIIDLKNNYFGLYDQDWVELWRTETITLLFEYTYYPLYRDPLSDLPTNVIKSSANKQTAPLTLPPDQLLLEVTIDDSEVVLVGLIIRLIIDLKNNYFGLYDQLTDVNEINRDTAPAPLYGNAIMDQCERYRPLSLRLCLRVGKIKGYCLVHSSKINSSSTDSCPVVHVDQIVLEIAKDPLGTMVQVGVGTASVQLKPSQDFPASTGGLLVLETFSFRGQALFSDLDVPWDAATLEYGWLMEIAIGQLLGKLHPTQMVFDEFTCPEYWNNNSCPVVHVDQIVLEIAKDPLGTMVQVGVGNASVQFKPSQDFPASTGGLLVLETFSFRGQALFSDLDVPWDAATLEYGWLMEIAIGQLLGKLHPTQLKYKSLRVSVEQLSLVVAEERCAFQLELRPIRLAYCNCHCASFCAAFLLKLPLVSLPTGTFET
ncbi:unnamed protein product [Gongylonema pulchrum]|uniref:FSA_C domain-containing protein n=1 Tax=Gongylonema pulchrum TaxID=637853 RepID=A0A183DR35_9BILA|nr:unnamed protein product [Gongylonema pulchrum]